MTIDLRSALQVDPEQIRRLDEISLRDLMTALLHAEGYRCRARQRDIRVSHEVKAKDEGCDGWSPGHRGRDEWLPRAPTCWQFKTGRAGEPGQLRGEAKKKKPREALKAGGAYVVVASAASGQTAAEDRLKVLREDAGRLPKEPIRVYTCETLAAWCNCYPAIAARLTGFPQGFAFLQVQQWESDPQFSQPYHASEETARDMAAVREGLSLAARGTSHVHIWGHPGVGKTRLALEIVRADALRLFTIYLPVYSIDVVSLLAQFRPAPQTHLIVVVDETPGEAVPLLGPHVRLADGRVRLLTIGPSPPADSYGIQTLALRPLGPEAMRRVVREQAPALPEEHVGFVVRFADGYVKLARIVCDALADDPDIQGLELLQQRRDVAHLMDRLLSGLPPSARGSLHVVALLSRVGWEGDAAREGQVVADCLGKDWQEVKRDVHRAHQQLGIAPLAGRLRYISPRPLALYLALEALQCSRDELRKLPEQLPTEAAREAFYRRLGELAEFPAAAAWVRQEIDRFFSLPDLQSASAARVWSHLALADPGHAAARMREILQSASPAEKQAFGEGRREVVWALVKLAWRRDSFEDAMLALAELAVAENESFNNNATGEFCARFQVVLGGTEVPYRERLAVLDQLLNRSEPAYQRLAVQALCRTAYLDETRLCHGEDHGIRPVRPEWHPDHREAMAARREAVRRLSELAGRGEAWLEEALVAAAHAMLRLLSHGGLPDEVSELVKTIATHYPRYREALRRDVAQHLELLTPAGERISEQVLGALTALHASLVDPSSEGRLRQFVGRRQWDAPESPPGLRQLVEDFQSDPMLIDRHLAWLTSGEAENAWEFGRLLGERDRDGRLLGRMTSRAGRGSDLRLACAYLAGLATHRAPGWLANWLDGRLTVEPPDDELVLEVTWRTGADENAARRVIELVRRGHLPAERFACLAYSNWAAVLDLGILHDLLEELVRHPKLRPTALMLLRRRLHRHAADLSALTPLAARLVSDPALVLDSRSEVWADVASHLAPTHAREVARTILAAHARREGSFLRFSLAANTLRQCAAHDPTGVWAELAPYLEGNKRAHFYVIGFPEGVIDVLPRDSVLEWAATSPDRRGSVVAHLAVPDFSRDDSLAAMLADRYGDREAVGSALFARLTTGGTWGSLSGRWSGLAARMEGTSRTTRLPGLRRWSRRAGEWLRGMEARDRDAEAERDLEMTHR
jgi:hypothetical protein